MKTKEEIHYIRQKVFPNVNKVVLTPNWEKKIAKGLCGHKSCKNPALPFQIFCEEHLEKTNSRVEINDLASIFGFTHDTVKTSPCRDWLEEKVNEFAGFPVPLPNCPVKFVKTFFNIALFNYQQPFFKAFVSLPKEKNEIVTALFVRQTGKNETIANAIAFLLLNYRNMRIGIFAPTERQAQAIGLQRVRERLTSNRFVRKLIRTDMKDLIVLENGSFIRAFTANPNSQIEGFTLNVAVLDESQDIRDTIVAHDIVPMLASTNGSLVKIGTAGGKNHFYRSIMANIERGKNHFQNNYLDVGKERPEYLNFVEAIAEEMGGKETPEFRSQFMNEWVDSVLEFISHEMIDEVVVDEIMEVEPNPHSAYVLGVDVGKDFDDTVLTLIRVDKSGYYTVVKFWNWHKTKYTEIAELIAKIYSEWRCSVVGVDSTKEDTFAELLEDKGLNVYRIRFNPENKSNVYKHLLFCFETHKIRFTSRGKEYGWHLRKFTKQITELQKEWRGNTLRVFTINDRYHDDYPDSVAIACYVAKISNLNYLPPPKKKKQITLFNEKFKIERKFAKEYFSDDKKNGKKGEKMAWENIYRILRGN